MGGKCASLIILFVFVGLVRECTARGTSYNYGDALAKSILFFEGQRSGKLPSTQRMNWRKDSALHDGSDVGMDVTGGYYDAGDNIKFNFPMAFSITVLAWRVVELGKNMNDQDLQHAAEALKWGTDYFLKATNVPGTVVAVVGDAYADHNCWERPEDMDTPRTTYHVNQTHPGSEVSAEIAAALAATSLVFNATDPAYSKTIFGRAIEVFKFADNYRGSYNTSVGSGACPYYCDFNGYYDELVWGGGARMVVQGNRRYQMGIRSFGSYSFRDKADQFICSILPESPNTLVKYSPGRLMFKDGVCNMQRVTSYSFLLLAHAQNVAPLRKRMYCGNVKVRPSRLIQFARSQVNYILGSNPMGMSYMVGFGEKYPRRIHHRGSALPSKDSHPKPIKCREGSLLVA